MYKDGICLMKEVRKDIKRTLPLFNKLTDFLWRKVGVYQRRQGATFLSYRLTPCFHVERWGVIEVRHNIRMVSVW